MSARFIAYRMAPLLVLVAIDAWFFVWHPEFGTWDQVAVGGYFVMPFVVLFGGGYIARQFKPKSTFGLGMLFVSMLIAITHPWLSFFVAIQLGLSDV